MDQTCNEIIALCPDHAAERDENDTAEVEYRAPIVGGADAAMLRNVTRPAISVFRPELDRANDVGVIVCPGGGWRSLAWEHEGINVANWLTKLGYTAIVLKYRVYGTPSAPDEYETWERALTSKLVIPPAGRSALRAMHEVEPYGIFEAVREASADDGRQALVIVRKRAADWGLSANKIGMLGFSAGAFLATDVALDPRGSPLAFVASIYGGETRTRQVPDDAPPLFAVVAQDDVVIYRMVERIYSDWCDVGRSAEFHVFRRGGHGFGTSKQGLPSDGWTELFEAWLGDLGMA